jgi:predicted dehydrogenase
MDKLGVAIVGLDHWYWAFDLAKEAAQSSRTRLVAVADPTPARAGEVAKRHSTAELHDLRAAVEHPDAQIVAITCSTDQAPDLIRAAAAAGKHILSVKPFALDLETADALVEAVRAAGVHLFPLESAWRLGAERARHKRWVDEGRIGAAIRYSQSLHVGLPQAWPGAEDSGWWLDAQRVPGGGWLDHAIYALDYARWLFGAEPTSVSGVAGSRRHTQLDLEDYGLAVFEFPNGRSAVIEDTWAADRGKSFSRSEILGTAGAICEDSAISGRVQVRGDFGHEGWIALEPVRGPMAVVEHLAAVIAGEIEPIATVQDARANLDGCIAFYRNAMAASQLPK